MSSPGNDALVLAFVTALLAIAIERFNLLTDDYITRQAREFVRDKNLAVDPALLCDFAVGAISVARLAPSGISVLTAAFAILHDQAPTFWWIYGSVIILLCAGAMVIRRISRRNFYAMSTEDVRILIKIGLHVTYTDANLYWIYILNTLVILLCAYFLWGGILWSP
jgi:hypothetical protein